MRTPRVAPPLPVVVVLGLLALAPPAGGQATDAEGAIPRELVVALLAPYAEREGTAAPQLIVGRTPAGLPPGVLPSGRNTRVLGALTYPAQGRAPRRSTIVVAMPGAPAEALATYQRSLEAAGWRHPDRSGPPGGGFVPMRMGSTLVLCRDSVAVTAWAVPRDAGAQLRLSILDGQRMGPCDRERRPPRRFDDDDAPEFPALTPPPGAEARSSGASGMGPGSRESATRLGTTLSPAAVVAHYAAQLQAAGWTLGDSLGGTSVAGRGVGVRDVQGRQWRGLLSVVAVGDSAERDVVLRVSRAGDYE